MNCKTHQTSGRGAGKSSGCGLPHGWADLNPIVGSGWLYANLNLALPEYLAARFDARQHPGNDKQQVGQAIEVLEHLFGDIFFRRETQYPPLRPSDHRSRHMAGSGGGTTPWQDEFLKRGQGFIERIQLAFETLDGGGLHHAVTGNAELPAEVEKVVLDLEQAGANGFRYRRHRQHDA